MFFISPPFGNYLELPGTISITGSFTLHERKGLFFQIIKTLYYSYELNGWVNKIGLRNKGIDWALKNIDKSHILSIAILEQNEIHELYKKIPESRNIEINISCPNVGHKMVSEGISKFVNPKREWCILKVSPLTSNEEIKHYYNQGFRQFHCCNTLPIENGGLSGKAIVPYTNEKIKYIRDNLPNSVIIAGGGVTTMEDVNSYKSKGANHFSASSVFFNPYKFTKLYIQYSLYPPPR